MTPRIVPNTLSVPFLQTPSRGAGAPAPKSVRLTKRALPLLCTAAALLASAGLPLAARGGPPAAHESSVRQGPAASTPGRPHVLLLTVDTLRADHLGVYGSKRVKTPHIDALASRGLLFEEAITTIGKTGPAFASAFSARYPPTHGARRNGMPAGEHLPLLAEILGEQGYTTGAFISNWTLRHRLSGLARGFDVYDEEFSKRRYGLGPSERRAESVIASTLAWVDQQAEVGKPLLIWSHFSEPHTPYDEHRGFEFQEQPGEVRTPQLAKRLRYASEVAFTDAKVGELLEALEERIDLSNTLIFFFADHGESIGEHDYWGHGRNVYWPNLDIPMMIAGPGVPRGQRSPMPASIIDVTPTLLAALGIGHDFEFDGLDLLALWRSSEDRVRFALGDRNTALREKVKERYEDPLQIGMQTRDIKTVFDFELRRAFYFDLAADPKELDSRANPPKIVEPPLRRQLANWYRALPKHNQEIEALSEEDRKQLESLGYTGGP